MNKAAPSKQSQKIVALYKNGTCSKDLRKKFGVSRQRICQILKRAGVAPHKHYFSRPQIDQAFVEMSFKKGLNVKQIAKATGHPTIEVGSLLLKKGYQLRRGKIIDENQVIKKYRVMGFLRLAKEFKIDHRRVKKILVKNGIKIRKPGDKT